MSSFSLNPRDFKSFSPEQRAAFAVRRRESAKRRRAANIALIAELKAQPCVRCGNTFPARCMDFHHRDPDKKEGDICRLARKPCGDRTLRREIEKCDLLCANCHRILHSEEEA